MIDRSDVGTYASFLSRMPLYRARPWGQPTALGLMA